MSYDIKRAAVLGAGIMGAGIAAQLANAGIPVLLLDVVPAEAKNSTDAPRATASPRPAWSARSKPSQQAPSTTPRMRGSSPSATPRTTGRSYAKWT